ncbi:hypothetical protein [Pseudomonas sp. FME51]|uniref:hypothetical protein n=1 Tax=Pseudomonas sp. FME51 TaxID=2742609 RepID=UPI001865F1A2|nr:hypothetical protein [Pseudomonas sp. FME51]
MKISELRERVRTAREEEGSTDALRQWLDRKLPALHRTIRMRDNAGNTLFNFIQAYIERVPDILEAAQSVANHAKMRPQLIPVLKVAEDFFLQPSATPEADRGLLVLLDEAYLAHRLVEEVNDRYVNHGGESLIPMSNTKANVIVYELLGEEYANQLDAAVDEAVNGLLPEDVFDSPAFLAYKAGIDEDLRQDMWRRWPSMAEELGVGLTWREDA